MVIDDQAVIASSLIGLPEADVKAALLQIRPARAKFLRPCPSKCNLCRPPVVGEHRVSRTLIR